METQSLLYLPKTGTAIRTLNAQIRPAAIVRAVARWATAGAIALFVVIAATWAATEPTVTQYFNAALWGAGFIFLALAVEVGFKRVYPLVVTGIALPSLALLGSRFSEEFSILAGAIIAFWLAYWVGHRK